MTSSRRIPLALCFDVEPDEADVALAARPWQGFERLLDRVDDLRTQLGDMTGERATFSWFLRMDPQVADSHGSAGWVADRYGDAFARLRDAGDIVGLHPHAWRWVAERRQWVADHGDPGWIERCLRSSIAAYQDAFGEPCRFIRWGDRFVSAAAIAMAAELGAEYDLTIEPGAPELRTLHRDMPFTGRLISMEYAPREPYRPSKTDPRVAASGRDDEAGLWEVPLTALDPDPVLSPLRWIGRRLLHYGRPLHRPTSMVAPMWPAQPFWRGVEDYIATARRPHLAFAVRSDAPIRPAMIGAFDDKISALRDAPLARRLVFTTPDDLVARIAAPVERGVQASGRETGAAAL